MKKINQMMGVMAILSGMMMAANANAQTCTPAPDCKSLGYVQTASECGVNGIKCPFGEFWYCGKKPVQNIRDGAILYTDGTISDTVYKNKVAYGIVINSTKRIAMSLANLGRKDQWHNSTKACASYAAGLIALRKWTLPSLEDLQAMFRLQSNIDPKLIALGGDSTYVEFEDYENNYWSSDKINNQYVRALNINTGEVYEASMSNSQDHARCVGVF